MAVGRGRLIWGMLSLGLAFLALAGVGTALPAEPGVTRSGSSRFRSSSKVIINELAWAGLAASSNDEWIELYNASDVSVELTGWVLAAVDGTPVITLEGTIAPYGTFLLEQRDDTTLSDIPADQIYVGVMANDGERLELWDQGGVLVDGANQDGGPWPAGSVWPDYLSMERVNPYLPDSDSNWGSNDGVIRNGEDAYGNPINGTPGEWNSTAIVADVGVVKVGPGVVLPGAETTYTLTIGNSGALTATGVSVTDTLPPGMRYLHTTSPYTLTRPDNTRLVWEIGALAADSGPISFSFTSLLTDAVIGTITNAAAIATHAIERDLADNLTEWGSWVDSSTYYADLVVAKHGPPEIAAGAYVTYAIGVGNSGGLTATGVVLTDVLPAGLGYVSQGSPFTFTHPITSVLVWEIEELAPGTSLLTWTVTGLVVDGTAGPLTNTVGVTSTTPEASSADNTASVMTMAAFTPTIRLTAVHFDALEGDDEAVQIANLSGAPASIGGWELTDHEGVTSFPAGAILAAGELVWVAQDAAAFRHQFGYLPDYEAGGSDPAVPDLIGAWPALANDGDEVVLLDSEGVPQDALVYKGGNIHELGWQGPAVLPYYPGTLPERGQILYRKLDQASGHPTSDTDSAGDWAQETADPINGRKVRFPGWDLERFFHTERLTETATLMVAIGPDALYPLVAAEIGAAERSLRIQSYAFENTALAGAAAARASAGVSVTVLLDGDPEGGVTDQERWVCQTIEAAGGHCFFLADDPSSDVYARYTHQHAQYIVVDGERALIGSGDLVMETMPGDEKGNGTAGWRGVYLVTDAPGVVAHLETLFSHDMDPADHSDILTTDFVGPPPAGYIPITATDWTTYTAYYTLPLTLNGQFAFEIIQAPENSLRDMDSLLGLLAKAGEGDTLLIEQSEEPLYWGEEGSNPEADPNPRIAAYVAAARRGVTVRVLLDGRLDDPLDPRGNWATCEYLGALARQEGLALACQLGDPTGLVIDNHMVLAQLSGRGTIHIGSLGGSEEASKANREVVLQVQSDEGYAYLAGMFERDWTHLVFLPLVMDRYGPADHLLISEVLYNPAGIDSDKEWVELYNPTVATVSLGGWLLGDARLPDDVEGMYLFPAGTVMAPNRLLVVAVKGDRFQADYGFYPDYELVNTLAAVPDLLKHPSWGMGQFALRNDGDELILLNSAGRPVDVLSWGDGSFADLVAHPGVSQDGASLERFPPWLDRDDCAADFREQLSPNPGTVP
jgi:cardiolipin synthase